MKKKSAIVEWKLPTVPNQKALTKESAPLLERCREFQITSEDHFIASAIMVQDFDKALARIGQVFDPFVAGLFSLHKMALTLRRQFTSPLEAGKNYIIIQRRDYRERQEKLKREAEAKLAAGLQKQQQKELEKQAKAAEREGNTEVAMLFREQKDAVPLPTINSEQAVPKQQGFVIRERWIYRITNPDLVQREFCSPDDKKIRPVVEALGPLCKIEGIEITRDIKEHSRSVNE